MLWTYISKRNCGAEIEEKKSDNGITKIEGKKSDKLICGNSITEIDHNKVICGTVTNLLLVSAPCGSLFHDCKFCSMTEIVQDFVTCTHVHVC